MSKSRLENGYIERVKKISDRLQTMQLILNPENSSGFSETDKKLDELESEFSAASDQNNKKFNILKDNLQRIELVIDKEHKTREKIFLSKSEEYNNLRNLWHADLSKYFKSQNDCESRVLSGIDSKFEVLRSKAIEEINYFKESEALDSLSQDVPKLKEFAELIVDQRKQVEVELNKRLSTGFEDVENELRVEKKMRQETEEAMLAMLRDVVTRIKRDLDEEKKNRETSEETLLSLLEETCEKISSVTNT